jgi:hypothetical protein
MNLGNRAAMIRRFYRRRVAEQWVSSSGAEAVQEAERTIEDGFRILLVDRAVGLITTYYEAGETDEAFEGSGAVPAPWPLRRHGWSGTVRCSTIGSSVRSRRPSSRCTMS